jgi:murein DD-endopeptidase MepM/ murein hydrolase activator NlpD
MPSHSTVFGRRREPHTVIIARGDTIRHFTLRPWITALVGSAVAAVTLGYFAATSYLVFRDDLIGAAVARQARMQHAYEDRISALRAQVDRITSRQLLDQQLMETKVSELLERQSMLTKRHGKLGQLLEKAEAEVAPQGASTPPVPTRKPDERASLAPAAPLAYASSTTGSKGPFDLWGARLQAKTDDSAADRADKLFVTINQSLRSIESDQLTRVTSLADDAYQTADQIADALREAGLPVDDADGTGSDAKAMGGPYISADNPAMFDAKVKELDSALGRLEDVREHARTLPIANPAAGLAISSTFGVRRDPILGTPALHSGMDFRAPVGSLARATAQGTVVKAGWNGGYGRMVEIDHGNGLTTRFAHLSQIDVKEGDKVDIGTVIGETGNSGRSTGPHLHYEVRRDGTAVDPLRFLKVGRKLAGLI